MTIDENRIVQTYVAPLYLSADTALIAEAAPRPAESSDALLLHGVYDMPKLVGVDEGTLWGDYFFLEALTRASRPDWQRYW